MSDASPCLALHVEDYGTVYCPASFLQLHPDGCIDIANSLAANLVNGMHHTYGYAYELSQPADPLMVPSWVKGPIKLRVINPRHIRVAEIVRD